MKRAHSPYAPRDLHQREALLTTADVARLLRVHPKHVYRLLRRGLPGHRVGGEWRFMASEVLRWSGSPVPADTSAPEREGPSPHQTPPPGPPALIAANGDLAVEYLLNKLTALGRPLFGHVQTDRRGGLELLKRDDVLASGCHGGEIPGALDDERLAFVHLVNREVVLAIRRGLRFTSLPQIRKYRVASRPATAGVRERFDAELRNHGLDPDAVHGTALVLPSHREVACAVARGDVDVGVASRAWADRVGLECLPLFREHYGLLIKASLLGHPRIIQICETVQTAEFRSEMASVRGYDARVTGTISYEPQSIPQGRPLPVGPPTTGRPS
jgi:excisionase family DNA binding protein